MPLATRCPACRTRFRIAPEQLQASDGWVRCGQCDALFDARLQLRGSAAAHLPQDPAPAADMEILSPVPAQARPAATDAAAGPTAAPSGPRDAEPAPDASMPADAPFVLTGLLRTRSGRPLDTAGADPMRYTPPGIDAVPHPSAYRPPTPPSASPPPVRPTGAHPASSPPPPPPPPPPPSVPPPVFGGRPQEARRDPEPFGAAPAPPAAWPLPDGDIPSALLLHTADSDVPQDQLYDPAFAAPASPPAGSADAAVAEDPELQRLSFMREARRRAFWGRPIVRVGVAFAGLLLLGTLALQVAHHERDRLAARFPGARPALAALCGAVGCSLAPLRQIEAVSLDHARFGRLGSGRYQLALGMRNGASTAIATPAAELTLTDAQGRTAFRRVLQPPELGAPAVLPAGGEWSGALALSVPDEAQAAAISDYGLLLFYP
jgi:predicted Zn finger-like uncharacterized protein